MVIELVFMVLGCMYAYLEYDNHCNICLVPPPANITAAEIKNLTTEPLDYSKPLYNSLIMLVFIHLGFLLTVCYKIYLSFHGLTKTVSVFQCILVDCRCCLASFVYAYA